MIKYYHAPRDPDHLYAETPQGWFSRLVFLNYDHWTPAIRTNQGSRSHQDDFRNYLVPLNEEDVSGIFRRDLFWVLGEERF